MLVLKVKATNGCLGTYVACGGEIRTLPEVYDVLPPLEPLPLPDVEPEPEPEPDPELYPPLLPKTMSRLRIPRADDFARRGSQLVVLEEEPEPWLPDMMIVGMFGMNW